MHFIWIALVGFVAGLIARALHPGKDSMGFIMTAVLGVAGAYAATFLGRFIGEETPWLHLDLSAAKNKGGLGLITSTTTGFGVRWAAAVAHEYFEKH